MVYRAIPKWLAVTFITILVAAGFYFSGGLHFLLRDKYIEGSECDEVGHTYKQNCGFDTGFGEWVPICNLGEGVITGCSSDTWCYIKYVDDTWRTGDKIQVCLISESAKFWMDGWSEVERGKSDCCLSELDPNYVVMQKR